MPVYAYKGLNDSGRNVSGIVDAETPKAARQKLRGQGIFPTGIVEEKHSEKGAISTATQSTDIRAYFDRITPQDLALLTRQLATLVGAGLPLTDCLSALIEQVENARQKRILSQIREHVVEGGNLADAMKQHPQVFSDLYVSMVRAGEASGALDIVLIRLADYTERAADLRTKVRSATTYPIVMGTISFAILLFLLSYVVPSITKIFEDTQQELPGITLVLLAISEFTAQYWWVIVLVIMAMYLGLRAWVSTPKGRLSFDTFTLKIPYFGKVLRKVALARFARTLSTLLNGGLPLLQSLDIVKHVVNNSLIQNAIEAGRDSIREGHSVAEPLRKSGQFPPLLVHMIAVGERSGELESMLGRAADAYDNEVEASVNSLSSVLAPVLVVFMGGIVAFMVIAILLPIFELNQIVG